MEDATRLVIVDAVQARKPPGTLIRLTGDEIPIFLDVAKVSPHQEGLQDLLAVAALRGYLPDEVVFWGAQGESLDVGLELSPAVADQVDELGNKVLEELAHWSIEPTRRNRQQAMGSQWRAPRYASHLEGVTLP